MNQHGWLNNKSVSADLNSSTKFCDQVQTPSQTDTVVNMARNGTNRSPHLYIQLKPFFNLHPCFPGTPALQANRKLSKSVTYELHKPRAYIYMTHHHAYFLHWHYLCRVVSCILQFLCYAMQLFSSRFPMNRERKCCNQSL